jgi:hypothetical protein
MMEAATTSETLVKLYKTTRRYNPEDSHLLTHRRENLKSYEVRDVDNRTLMVRLECHYMLRQVQAIGQVWANDTLFHASPRESSV